MSTIELCQEYNRYLRGDIIGYGFCKPEKFPGCHLNILSGKPPVKIRENIYGHGKLHILI